jgi:hypothetical protein
MKNVVAFFKVLNLYFNFSRSHRESRKRKRKKDDKINNKPAKESTSLQIFFDKVTELQIIFLIPETNIIFKY